MKVIISEGYKNRLQELAGIILEFENVSKDYAGSEQRVPFNKEMMAKAIREGHELGMSFQSNNEKYKMPVAKWRVIYPVAMGTNQKGNLVIRGFHKYGQSESAAIAQDKRSAEVEQVWRLFKASNIKSMWFTGNFFRLPLPLYNESGDGGMISIDVQAKGDEIIRFQDQYNQTSPEKDKLQKAKNIVNLFKDTGERPAEQPISNPSTPSVTPSPKPVPVKKQSIRKSKKPFDNSNSSDSM